MKRNRGNRLVGADVPGRPLALLLIACWCGAAFGAAPVEIRVSLTSSADTLVAGERGRVEVKVENASADVLEGGLPEYPDALRIELFRASDRRELTCISDGRFVAPFVLKTGEGKRFEAFLSDHFDISKETRYLARAVLVHAGLRYESSLKAIEVVPGLHVSGALQMFSNAPGLKREFELVYWMRGLQAHLFLKAKDRRESREKKWHTTDLGSFVRVDRPKISVQPSGEVIVLHRGSQDSFIRSTFWSLPEALEFQENEVLTDPDIAGAERVKSVYKDAGGVEPPKPKWYEFWKK